MKHYAGFENYKTAPIPSLRRALFEQISGYSNLPGKVFINSALKTLIQELPIQVASFYSYDKSYEKLVLIDQIGFSFGDYEYFVIPKNSPAGNSVEARGSISINLEAETFINKSILVGLDLQYAIAKSLHAPENSNNTEGVIAVIVVYPINREDEQTIRDVLDEISTFLGSQLYWAYERELLEVRRQILDKAHTSSDLNSCLHKILMVTKELLSAEVGSIFLYDEKVELLKLRATTGIHTALKNSDVFYSELDSKSYTWKVFQTGKQKNTIDLDAETHEAKFLERTRGRRRSFVAVPIRRKPKGSDVTPPIGVLRLINKTTRHGNHNASTPFSWIDHLILGFISDLISGIVHISNRADRQKYFFEGVMHGASSSIQASIDNLDTAKRHANIEALLPDVLKYTFCDTLEFLSDLREQMRRLSANGPLFIEEFHFSGEIGSKIVTFIERMFNMHDVRAFEVTNLREAGFYSLPPIRADKNALFTVFRNLAENSVKYRDARNSMTTIKLAYSVTPDFVEIKWSDNGIGIPQRAAHKIFTEGFRAENAIRTDPTGSGLGLAQSCSLITEMGGHIFLEEAAQACFRILIPRAIDKSRPSFQTKRTL